ncbi:Protein of unknown function [Bacillus toyonensis]|nr:Protein of unknown function [Bacillus toyonensis]
MKHTISIRDLPSSGAQCKHNMY